MWRNPPQRHQSNRYFQYRLPRSPPLPSCLRRPFCHNAVISGDIQGFLHARSGFRQKKDAVLPFNARYIIKIAIGRKGVILVPSFDGCFPCKQHCRRKHFHPCKQLFSVLFPDFVHFFSPFPSIRNRLFFPKNPYSI